MTIYDDSLDRLRLLELYALGEMHDRLYPEIYRYVYYRLGSSPVSEEIASAVFSGLLDALRHQRGPKSNLRGWLFKLAAKIVNQELRRMRFRNQADKGVDKAFWSAFRHLTFEQQHILALRFAQGRPLEDVALITEKPLNSVRKIQFRALVDLVHQHWGIQSGRLPGVIKENETSIRAIEVGLQSLLAGDELDEVLAHYPQITGNLKLILKAAQAGRVYGASLAVPDRAMALARTNFLSEAVLYKRHNRTSTAPIIGRGGLLLLGITLALILGMAGLVIAARQTLPGDRWYWVKPVVENTRLFLAIDPAQKLSLQRLFDQERLQEVQRLARQQRLAAVSFVGLPSRIAGQEWIIGGVPVQVLSDAQVIGEVDQDIYLRVVGTLQPEGYVLARRIQAREYIMTGSLLVQTAERWVIGRSASMGVEVRLNGDTVIQGAPRPGERVEARLVELSDGSWLARWVKAGQ